MAIRRVKPRTIRPKRKPKLGLKDVLGPKPSKKPKRDYPVDKPKRKKLPHERLLEKYLKGDIPFTVPAGTKKIKDKLRDLLKRKENPAARTGPIKPKTKKKPSFKDVMGPRQTPKKPKMAPGGPWNPKDKKDPVPGGPYKPRKGPRYMKPMKTRKK